MSKGQMVVIGNKQPSGVILELGKFGDSGYRRVLLKGANEGAIRADGLFIPSTVGGFGRTEVPLDFWNAYKTGEDCKTSDEKRSRVELVKEWQDKNVVFVADSPDLAIAQANEKAAVKTGFEGLDPTKKVGDIEANPEALAELRRANFGATQAA